MQLADVLMMFCFLLNMCLCFDYSSKIIQLVHSPDDPAVPGLCFTRIFVTTVSHPSQPEAIPIISVIGQASKHARPDWRFRKAINLPPVRLKWGCLSDFDAQAKRWMG